MKKSLVLTWCVAAFAAPAVASPPPPLAWDNATVNARVAGYGEVVFKLKCPSGKLTGLSAQVRDKTTELDVKKLNKLDLPNTCSGLRTTSASEGDGGAPRLISLELDLSAEYDKTFLWIYFDLKTGEFTDASFAMTHAGQKSKTMKVKL